MKKFLQYYHAAARHRRNWSHWKFRLFMVIATMAGFFAVMNHLEANFRCSLSAGQCASLGGVFLSELLFQWFVAGAFFGFLVFAILMEGEFALGIRKIVRALENDVEEVEKIEKKVEQEGRTRQRKAPRQK